VASCGGESSPASPSAESNGQRKRAADQTITPRYRSRQRSARPRNVTAIRRRSVVPAEVAHPEQRQPGGFRQAGLRSGGNIALAASAGPPWAANTGRLGADLAQRQALLSQGRKGPRVWPGPVLLREHQPSTAPQIPATGAVLQRRVARRRRRTEVGRELEITSRAGGVGRAARASSTKPTRDRMAKAVAADAPE